MVSERTSIHIGDRLQKAIGPAGGFPLLPGMVYGQPATPASVNRRVNNLGDRYAHLIESADIESVLSGEELRLVANVFCSPWQYSAERVSELPAQVADGLGLEFDDYRDDDGEGPVNLTRMRASGNQGVVLVAKLAEFTPLQLMAVVEWMEQYFPDLGVEDDFDEEN